MSIRTCVQIHRIVTEPLAFFRTEELDMREKMVAIKN
jgi:hypothetical protein